MGLHLELPDLQNFFLHCLIFLKVTIKDSEDYLVEDELQPEYFALVEYFVLAYFLEFLQNLKIEVGVVGQQQHPEVAHYGAVNVSYVQLVFVVELLDVEVDQVYDVLKVNVVLLLPEGHLEGLHGHLLEA